MERRFIVGMIAGTGLIAASAAAPALAEEPAAAWVTDFHAWTTSDDFAAGSADNTSTVPDGDGALTLAPGQTDGTWTSPWYRTPSTFTESVPSWQADTPGASWIEVEFQVRSADGNSRWYVMAQWAFDASEIKPQTYKKAQGDAIGTINTDTFVAAPGVQAAEYRVRATLHGTTSDTPTVGQLAATTSAPGDLPPTSSPISNEPAELAVPMFSQETHHDEYKKFGGGGEVWCSPTSVAMILSYYQTGPTPDDIASMPKDKVFDANGRVDGQVPWAAIHQWDYTYGGAGNWAFSTAYASSYGLDGSVRQYANLRPVEEWIREGVPLVVSIAWNNGDDDPSNDLDGSSITSTAGHLMAVVGFTADGDVIANDPASPTNADVRHVYKREQFERNWLRASDGTTYVIRPAA